MEARMCRVCLEHSENMVNIFDRTQDSGTCIANILSQWSGYPVERNDPFPKTICMSCLQDAEKTYEMEETFHQIQKDSLEEQLIEEEVSSGGIIQVKEELVPDIWSHEEDLENQLPCRVINEPLEEDVFEEEYFQISDSDFDGPVIEGACYDDPVIEGTFYDDPVIEGAHCDDLREATISKKDFECSHCPKTFSLERGLMKHLVSHGVRPLKSFECPHCPKTFPLEWSLTRHLVTHGERPFKCSLCPSTFKINKNFKVHMRVHTG
ncbi:hypothetical protein KR084_006256, partial [Drosophila pseudotakahashii]